MSCRQTVQSNIGHNPHSQVPTRFRGGSWSCDKEPLRFLRPDRWCTGCFAAEPINDKAVCHQWSTRPLVITSLTRNVLCFARFWKGSCENSDHYRSWMWVGLVDQYNTTFSDIYFFFIINEIRSWLQLATLNTRTIHLISVISRPKFSC